MEVEGRSVVGVVADAARREDAERLVEAARSEFGRLDVLVNNAGITRDALLVRMKDDDWDRVMETNLRGAFLMTRAAGRVMMRQRSGRIVNITSTAGVMGNAGQANYSAAKAGLIGLTKATARELAHWQILINAVAPGLIETDMTAAIPADCPGSPPRSGPAGAGGNGARGGRDGRIPGRRRLRLHDGTGVSRQRRDVHVTRRSANLSLEETSSWRSRSRRR